MRSSDTRLLWLMLRREIRNLLLSRSLWLMLIILSLLTGYSFIEAVDLFSKASETALSFPELARGMNPVEGIFLPTFGAYYLVETLLFPFVVIRLVAHDKQSGTLKLQLQLPLSSWKLNAIKMLALGFAALLFLLPAISTIVIWHQLGGTIYLPQLLTLLLGHALYTLAIACIALFASVVSSTPATAAMICLAATLGSWVLDFAAASGGWMSILSQLSLTTWLRPFEAGLLSSQAAGSFLALSALLFLAASILHHPGRRFADKLKTLAVAIASIALLIWLVSLQTFYFDATASHRHSLNPADEQALKTMHDPLTITIHLAPDDGRLYDFAHGVLAKLRRAMPRLNVAFVATQSTGLFGAPEDEHYGLIEFDYQGHHDETYSTSEQEILPLIHGLAGNKPSPIAVADYAGDPLVADASGSWWWFYLALPMLFLLMAWRARQYTFIPLWRLVK